MREIIFRGKRADSGEWLTNSETYIADGDGIWLSDEDLNVVRIIPETLGQYTELSDKNGVKIFEGDILTYKDKVYEVKYSEEQARFIACLNNGVFDPAAIKNGVVVGNIHDDPELMGGDTE